MSETSLPANVDFSSVNTLKTVLSVLVLLSFLDGVCNLCVCVFFFFRAAIRAFSLACPTYCCFITLHILSFFAIKRERECEQLAQLVQKFVW